MRVLFLSLLLSCLVSGGLSAQVAKDQVLMLKATANNDGSITLTWPKENWAGTYKIFRRGLNDEGWGDELASVPGSEEDYTDETAEEGKGYDYLVTKTQANTNSALGYIYAGNKKAAEPSMGGIIVVVDDTYKEPLSAEIERLSNDLLSEGWNPELIYVKRDATVTDVKEAIKKKYEEMDEAATALFLLGHVPVPYSGNFSGTGTPPPDGHVEGRGNHTGAWAADAYYADINKDWPDELVNLTTGAAKRNHNVPNDGKFDPSKLPSELELELGRVDLFDMPIFNESDTGLLKKYLDRNHEWRTGQLQTVERALIDNNLNEAPADYNLASTGYHNFSTMIEHDSIFDDRDYFGAMQSADYLWSYGCGFGSNTSCSGVGRTRNFANIPLKNVFTILAGSYFGDWDSTDNFLRAPLANSALVSFWGGIPKWYVHHMALGKHIGYGTRATQNNTDLYFNGGFNLSHNSVHIALMGDPTLRMRNLAKPDKLEATSRDRNVMLSWEAAERADGYYVFRVDKETNEHQQVGGLISGTSYTDAENWFTGSYTYAVRAVKLETTPSGTWYNLSGGVRADVEHINAIGTESLSPIAMTAYPNPSNGDLSLKVESPIDGSALLQILSLQGKVLQQISLQLQQGENQLVLNLNDLTTGTYVALLSSEKALNGRILISRN